MQALEERRIPNHSTSLQKNIDRRDVSGRVGLARVPVPKTDRERQKCAWEKVCVCA